LDCIVCICPCIGSLDLTVETKLKIVSSLIVIEVGRGSMELETGRASTELSIGIDSDELAIRNNFNCGEVRMFLFQVSRMASIYQGCW
jgi:hypothetical protein